MVYSLPEMPLTEEEKEFHSSMQKMLWALTGGLVICVVLAFMNLKFNYEFTILCIVSIFQMGSSAHRISLQRSIISVLLGCISGVMFLVMFLHLALSKSTDDGSAIKFGNWEETSTTLFIFAHALASTFSFIGAFINAKIWRRYWKSLEQIGSDMEAGGHANYGAAGPNPYSEPRTGIVGLNSAPAEPSFQPFQGTGVRLGG